MDFEYLTSVAYEGNLIESDQLIRRKSAFIWSCCKGTCACCWVVQMAKQNASASELAKETPDGYCNSGGYFLNCNLLLCYSSNLHSAVSSWQPEPLWLCAVHGLEIQQKSRWTKVYKNDFWIWAVFHLPDLHCSQISQQTLAQEMLQWWVDGWTIWS